MIAVKVAWDELVDSDMFPQFKCEEISSRCNYSGCKCECEVFGKLDYRTQLAVKLRTALEDLLEWDLGEIKNCNLQ